MKVRRVSKAIQAGDGHVLKPSRTLQGLSRYKLPHVPHFLFVEKSFSLLGYPRVPKSRLKQLIIREMRKCRNKEKAVKQRK